MKNINSYIIEKLHLKKGSSLTYEITKEDIVRFIVIYSDCGKVKYSMYSTYKLANECAKENFFLDGYCLTEKQLEDIIDIIDKNQNVISMIAEYAKEHKLIRLFSYDTLK